MPAYLFETYDFGHYPGAHHARMNRLAADGWRIYSAAPNFTECSVLWEHPDLESLEDYVPSKDKDVPVTDLPARDQYLAQQDDAMSPQDRRDLVKQRAEAREQAEQRDAEAREQAWERELEMREQLDKDARAEAEEQEAPKQAQPHEQPAARGETDQRKAEQREAADRAAEEQKDVQDKAAKKSSGKSDGAK